MERILKGRWGSLLFIIGGVCLLVIGAGAAQAAEPAEVTITLHVPAIVEIIVTTVQVNLPPVLDTIGNKTIDEGQTLTFTVSAIDPDGDTLTYSASGLPSGASFVGQTFSWTPAEDQDGLHTVTVIVSDGIAQAQEDVAITVTEVNLPPVLASIGDKSVDEEVNLSFTISATDPDIPANTLTYTVINLPDGATFTNQTFSWTPSEAQGPSSYDVTFKVSDGPLTDSEPITIIVNEVSDAPVADAQEVTTAEDTPVSITLSGSDVEGDPITFALASSPANGTLGPLDPNSGVVEYTSNLNYNGSDSFTFRTYDGELYSDPAIVSITVTPVNDDPLMSAILDQSATEEVLFTYDVEATDVDIAMPGDTLTFSLDAKPAGMTIDSTTGAISWIPTNTQAVQSYEVTVRVKDSALASATRSFTIVVANLNDPPIAEAGDDQTVNESDTVQFSGTATDDDLSNPSGEALTYAWDFGDGETVSGTLTPTHTYGDDGAYTVTLTVTDSVETSHSDTLTVTVNNVAPLVEAGGDQSTNEGTAVNLDSATFTDAGWLDTHTATIDWGDGTIEDGIVAESEGSGIVSKSHTYGDNGTYTVTVTVTDDDGGVGTDTLTVTVNNVSPVVEAGGDQATDEGTTVSLAPATFSDAGSGDTHTATIDWGDGTIEDGTVIESQGSGTVSGSHAYGDDGVYEVRVTVADDDDDVGFDTLTITVKNVAPAANAGSNQTVKEDTVVHFIGSHTDPGWLDTHTYEWDFADPDDSTSGTGTNPTHTFIQPGLYTVTLTVTDDDGEKGTDILTVTVLDTTPPEIEITFPADGYITNQPVTVTYDASDNYDTDLEITWSPGPPPYEAEGTYTVTATATDDAGLSDSDSVTFIIDKTPPVITITSPVEDLLTRDDVTLQYTYSDDVSPQENITVRDEEEKEPPFIYTEDGDYTITITVTDEAGNPATDTISFRIDKTPPSFEIVVNPDPASTGGVTILIVASEPLINDPAIRLTDNAFQSIPISLSNVVGNTYTYSAIITEITAEGIADINVGGIDIVGNLGVGGGIFVVDLTPFEGVIVIEKP